MNEMPKDGGSYRREPDGSLTCLDGLPAIQAVEHVVDPDPIDLEPQEHDGSATALPPIETQPRRSRRDHKE
jgi:hypothetical protein